MVRIRKVLLSVCGCRRASRENFASRQRNMKVNALFEEMFTDYQRRFKPVEKKKAGEHD